MLPYGLGKGRCNGATLGLGQWGVVMRSLNGPLAPDEANALVRKFKNLGMDGEEELQALLGRVKVKRRVSRGEDIVRIGSAPGYSTVLLTGVACRYKMIENGRRQIFTFQYPGDFCDFHRYVLSELNDAVAAVTDCSIGVILHEDIGRITAQYPKLGLALWRDTLLEARIFRERLLNVGHRPALPRIAHLICEQMARLEAIGTVGTVIPLTQVDLADAAGLSVVHMNRTVQDLRELGILSKNRRGIEVVHREGLVDIAKFDWRYLNIPQVPVTRQPRSLRPLSNGFLPSQN
jgi:CRP-like cAMP-binding protein